LKVGDQLSGKSLRGYELRDLIGSGGFGAVYRAYQPAVDREVAIKVILPEFAQHPDFVARFEAEARTVAKLEHPHIVPLYDYWHDVGGAFLVMRYLKGGSLRDRLEASGALELAEVGRILEQICEALHAAHESAVIHRDLKPENILLDERGQAYLTDFGIAKDLAAETQTRAGMLLGSVAYLAPEQAKAEKVTPRTDVYALGVLIYELLTGQHPFPALDPVQVIQHHLNQPLPPLSATRPGLPGGFEHLVQQATAKIPGHRYPSAAALWADFHGALGAASQPTPTEWEPTLPAFLESVPGPGPATFVGRDREMARLESQLGAALDGRGRVAFIAGGAGQGKTALALAFARRAEESHSDLIVLSGQCNAQAGIGDPYLPFREALDQLTGGVEAKWASGVISTEGARRLWTALPLAIQTMIELAPDLVDRMAPGTQLIVRAAAVSPQATAWRKDLEDFLERRVVFQVTTAPKQIDLFEQLTRLFRQVSERSPLLLILDDLQWADDASISLLFHLGRRIADRRVLVLCAYRPDEVALGRDGDRHPLEQVIHELVRLHGENVLDLAESAEAAGMGFIDSFLDSEPNRLGTEFRQALYQRTGGHPLFTIELLRALQERGDLRKDGDGYWEAAANLAWDELPARVEAVIEERIGRLEGNLRELLAVASVEGHDFTAQVLARIQALEERKLLRELSQELEKRHRLVREMGEVRTGHRVLSRYQFAHQLFQRYLYNGLSAGERRLLHGEIAAVLEELFADDLSHGAVQLAYHYGQAALPEKAAPYVKQAGDQAKASYANQEAIRYYSEWLELQPNQTAERFDVLATRAEVNKLIGKPQDERADVEAMLYLSQELGDQTRRCDALLALADHYLETEHILAREPAEQALEIARRLDDPIREGGALRRLGWGEWVKHDFVRSRGHLEQAVERFRAANRLREAATSLHMLSLTLSGLTEYEAGMQAAQEAVQLSREAGDRRLQATSLRRLAIQYEAQNRFEEAKPIAEQALALHQEVGDYSEQAHALNVLGILHAWLGNFEISEELMWRSLEIGEALRGTTAVQFAAYGLFTVHYWHKGEYEGALHFIDEQLGKALAIEHDWLVGAMHLYKGLVLQAYGRFEEALTAHNVARSTIERLAPDSLPHANTTAWVARHHADLGQFDLARTAAAEALAIAERSGDPTAVVAPLAYRAYLTLREGDPKMMTQAVQDLDPAIRRARDAREYEGLQETLNIAAGLRLALGQAEEALAITEELLKWLNFSPSRPAPHEYFYNHSRALKALGRSEEAESYLRRAYDWIMLVAGKTTDEALRKSWLEDARSNPEILAAAAERGIGTETM
jgi:tetratricopeptide (TPR) repeat protein